MNKSIFHQVNESLRDLASYLESSPELSELSELLDSPIADAINDLDVILGEMEVREPQTAYPDLINQLDQITSIIPGKKRAKLSNNTESKLLTIAEKLSKLNQSVREHHNPIITTSNSTIK